MADLRRLGVGRGGITMVHTRMSARGWVIGGSETVVRALLDVLGPDGTLMAYASWADHVYTLEDRPEEYRAAYRAEPPRWDPATGEVDPDHGRIPERVRTWPGAVRSVHPEASVVAVGPRAASLTAEHDDGYEIAMAGGTTRSFTDIDTSHGAHPYELLGLEADEFAIIAREALAAGIGVRGQVGQADCHLFPAPELTRFAVAWIEERFG